MPYHTITEFSFADFIAAALDYLLADPLVLSALVAAACYVVIRLCFAIAEASARKRVKKGVADRLAAWTVAQAQQKDALVHTRMKSVVNLTEHRRNTKGAA